MLTPPTPSSAWQGPTSTPFDALTLAPKHLSTGPTSSSTAAAAGVFGPGLSSRLATASPPSCPAHIPTSVLASASPSASASAPPSRLNPHKPRGIKRSHSPSGSAGPASPSSPSTPSVRPTAAVPLRKKESSRPALSSNGNAHSLPSVGVASNEHSFAPVPSQPRLSLSSLFVPTALPIASPPPSPVLRTHRAPLQAPSQGPSQSQSQSQSQAHAAKRLRRLSCSSHTSASDSEDEDDSQSHSHFHSQSNLAKPDRGRMNFPLPPGFRIGPSPLHQEFSFSIQTGTGNRSISHPKAFGLPAGRDRPLRGLWSTPAPLTPISASTSPSDEPVVDRAPTPAEKDEMTDRLSPLTPLTPLTAATSVPPLAPLRNTTPNTNTPAAMPTPPLVLSKARARIMGLVNPDQPEKAGMEIEKVFALGYGRALGRSKANGAVMPSGLGLRGVARWVREDRVASTAAGQEQREPTATEEQERMEDIKEKEKEMEEEEEEGSKEGMDIDEEV